MKTAKTKAQLASEMSVSVNTISAWQLKPSFPSRGRHGWDVDQVRRWREEHRPAVNAELVAEERRENIELKRTKRKILIGDYVLKSEVANDLTLMVTKLKDELKRTENELASKVVGMTVAQAKQEIKAAHDRVLLNVSSQKWGA